MTPSVQLAGQDADARRRIHESLDESLIVEASAGTGKTTELINRIVQVLARGRAQIDQIVAVTFTNKAAGELKLRLRQKLDEERLGADEQSRRGLEDALERLEEASISTIHSFCAQILRSRPVEARIDPAFEELTQQEAARIYERAFQSWFERQLDCDSPGLQRTLARLAWREDWDNGPAIEQIKAAGRKLVEFRDFRALWRPDAAFDLAACKASIEALLADARELSKMAATCPRPADPLAASLRCVRDLLAWIDRGQITDAGTLEAVLLKLGRDLKSTSFRKGRGFFSECFSRESVIRAYENLRDSLDRFRTASGILLACQLQQEMQSLIDDYTSLKAKTGKLDFTDLLLRAFELVEGNDSVRHYLQNRFTHIFVDEFQDTDPLQAAILLLIAAANPSENNWRQVTPSAGKLFIVGDPKQSIYKFRRADVSLYDDVCTQLEARGVGRVYLTSSHRSLLPIKQFVNAAFGPAITGDKDAAQAAYSPLNEDGGEIPGQPSIVALPIAKPYGSSGRVTKKAIDECLPSTIAAFIRGALDRGQWQVREKDQLVALEARHICILFRRFINFQNDLTRDYVRALEARDVPHLLVGSKSFHDREEVQTIRTALAAIEWPEDELSVYAVLRGSLFAITDAALLRFRHEHKKLHPFRNYPADLPAELAPVTQALAVLADLHRFRNSRPVADTVRLLLDEARAYAGFAIRPGGQQVLANVLRICDLAREYELTGGFSFRGFVDELTAQAEKTEAPEAPVLEEGAGGVRLMTVHNAKGLEFPVVVLADMTANISSQDPDRYIDPDPRNKLCATRLLRCAPRELLDNEQLERQRENAEGVRVCYVAATRARDLLVVPVVGDAPQDGWWLSPLNKALYPLKKNFRAARPCDSFRGTVSVWDRPFPVDDREDPSVRPGFHQPEIGAHSVLWWDPASLNLNVPENFGLKHVHLLKAEGVSDQSLREYEHWRAARREILSIAANPSVEVVRVTDLIEEPPPAPVAIERANGDGFQSAGQQFGTLVHAIIRDAPWHADRHRLQCLAAMHGQLLGATQQAELDAASAAARLLAHPLLERAAASTRCFHELPITFPLTGKRVLEGVIDLAFLDHDRWHVIDFKTGEDLHGNRSAYQRQLRWYMHALSKITGLPVRGTLLQV
jgi:ATP-dependent helicase/nuclease subunit A